MTRKMLRNLSLLAAVTLLAIPAEAEESVYTSLALESCKFVPPSPDDPLQSGLWLCSGHSGIPVRVAEGDLRFFVSYGPNAAFERAAAETLPQFNTINATLEWRLDDAGLPFATILRYFADYGDGGPPEQVLVVTRLGEEEVCHVAYVNASANPDANLLARQAADLIARNFLCDFHLPVIIGNRGRL